MSLVAIVYCKCVEEGKATIPPFDRSLLANKEDGRLDLQLPEGHEKQILKEQKHQWEKSCCTHPWRYYLNEWVGDWQGVQLLHSALTDLGVDQFPTLMTRVPLVNTGLVSCQESAQALLELNTFEQYLAQGKFMLASLVDVDSGAELCANSYKKGRCIYFTGDHEYWFDGHGLRILGGDGKLVFESLHFEQALVKGDVKSDATSSLNVLKTVFTDKKTGATYHAKGDIRIFDVRYPDAIPAEFKVTGRACSADGFDYIVRPLKRVFQTSVEVGRPVVWA